MIIIINHMFIKVPKERQNYIITNQRELRPSIPLTSVDPTISIDFPFSLRPPFELLFLPVSSFKKTSDASCAWTRSDSKRSCRGGCIPVAKKHLCDDIVCLKTRFQGCWMTQNRRKNLKPEKESVPKPKADTHTHTHTYIPTNKTTFMSCHVMSCHVAPAELWASCSTTNKGPAPSSSQISSTSAGKSYRRLPENQWSFQAPGGHVVEVPWDNSPHTATEVWTSLEKNMWIKDLLQLQHWIMLYAAHNT